MLTVTVNDRPIDVAAIVERGRVLLPMRATFTALGASVGYNPRGHVIIARSATHALRLTIGLHEAIVDGRRMALDVPARIVATRTYVPLRFVAQAMGAVVGYDARAQLVSVVSNGSLVSGGTVSRAPGVLGLTPAPQSVMGSAYPTISASLGSASASRSDITLTVDGEDVTALASFDGTTITYMPRIGLSRGPHTVRFAGRTLSGQTFSASWTFETSLQAPPDAPSFTSYDYRFYASGPTFYYPGDWMHFVLIAPPGGSAQLQLCGMGFQYALWNTGYGSVYEANFPAPRGYWMPSCAVTAIYTAWNGRQYYVPIPVIIGVYTGAQPGATPRPQPPSSPRPVPIGPRRPEPAATPRPLPTRLPLPQPNPPAHTPPPVRHTPVPAPRAPLPIIRRPLPHPRPTPQASAAMASRRSSVPS